MSYWAIKRILYFVSLNPSRHCFQKGRERAQGKLWRLLHKFWLPTLQVCIFYVFLVKGKLCKFHSPSSFSRGTLGGSLRSPEEVEGNEGFPPQPEKDLESPSSTPLEDLAVSHDSRVMTSSPSPCAWRHEFPWSFHCKPLFSEPYGLKRVLWLWFKKGGGGGEAPGRWSLNAVKCCHFQAL